MKKLGMALCLLSTVFTSLAQAQWEGNFVLGATGGHAWPRVATPGGMRI